MPTYIANGVYNIVNGSWIAPSQISTLLMTPLALSRPIQSYTRSSSDVQNGNITNSKRTFLVDGLARAIPYAIGYPIKRQSSVEMNATLIELSSAFKYSESVNKNE